MNSFFRGESVSELKWQVLMENIIAENMKLEMTPYVDLLKKLVKNSGKRTFTREYTVEEKSELNNDIS